jgi:hypothetical protein
MKENMEVFLDEKKAQLIQDDEIILTMDWLKRGSRR